MKETTFRNMILVDVTPPRCKRKQVKVFDNRRHLLGRVVWGRHSCEYFMALENGWNWNANYMFDFRKLLTRMNKENAG